MDNTNRSIGRSSSRLLPVIISERAQEVQNVLLLGLRQVVEIADHAVCLGLPALMGGDSLQQVARPSVMQEIDPLSQTPKRCRPEFVAGGGSLKPAWLISPCIDELELL